MRICVPITATTTPQALADIAQAEQEGADILELRIDFLTDLSPAHLSELLQASELPLILTARLQEEGGHWSHSLEEREKYFRQGINAEVAFVDFEFSQLPKLDLKNTKAIYSQHDFKRMPENPREIYDHMIDQGADIAKIVGMAHKEADADLMLDLIKSVPQDTIIAIAMGKLGRRSRLEACQYGAYLTFAALDEQKSSAPGQVSIPELIKIRKESNLAIIGGRGSGKTTYATKLAQETGRMLCSMDAIITEEQGMSIPELVKKQGWPHFRDLEYRLLRQLSSRENIIIDCGGGIICEQSADGTQSFSERKSTLLSRIAHVIWLDTPIEQQLQNLQPSSDRPALSQNSANFLSEHQEIMQLRRPWYQKVADEVKRSF